MSNTVFKYFYISWRDIGVWDSNYRSLVKIDSNWFENMRKTINYFSSISSLYFSSEPIEITDY